VVTEAALFAAALLSGLLAGHELATLVSVHPALRRFPLRARIEAEQTLTRRRGAVMPVCMGAPFLAGVAAAVASAGRPGFGFALAAAAALGIMLAITLVRNVPLNRRTLAFPPDGDEHAWSDIRRPWERLHALRVALEVGAFACLLAAVAAG
jgi:uncharacterized membrane protein